jgi:hypothetical protein
VLAVLAFLFFQQKLAETISPSEKQMGSKPRTKYVGVGFYDPPLTNPIAYIKSKISANLDGLSVVQAYGKHILRLLASNPLSDTLAPVSSESCTHLI